MKFWGMLLAIVLIAGAFFNLDATSGHSLTDFLGKSIDSEHFQKAKNNYELNEYYISVQAGIRFSVSEQRNAIDTVFVAGFTCAPYQYYKGQLPFGILINDDLPALRKKFTSEPEFVSDGVQFKKDNYYLLVHFAQTEKIEWIKIFSAEGQKKNKSRAVAKKASPVEDNSTVVRLPAPKVKLAPAEKHVSTFRQSIYNLFEVYKESQLSSIKGKPRKGDNFWKYKHTFTSDISIPGELYSMVYAFPFKNSQLDYVSVLLEDDNFNADFKIAYKKFEEQLKTDFPAKEGWTYNKMSNPDAPEMNDLEVSRDNSGAIVLDYCKNPSGRSVLYLRFLFFSN